MANTLELFIRARDLASRGLKKVEDGLEGVGDEAKKANLDLKKMAAGVTAVAATATAIGAKGVQAFASFEKKMKEVNTLVNLGDAEFQKMTKDVEKLSIALGVDATEASGALYQALSAGVPQENAISFLDIASKAAIGGVTDTETAVDGLTTVLNAFKIPAQDTQKVADAMFATVKQGKTTFAELSKSMFQAGPIAASLGVDFQDVLGATATLTKQGTPTSVAMTQIRSALTALSAPTTEMTSIFNKLNVKGFDELLKREGSLIKVFQALRTATGDNKEQMQKMFGRVEAVAAILGTTGQNARIAATDLDTVTNSAGSATTAFNEMATSLDKDLKVISNFVDQLVREIGQDLAPLVSLVADKIGEINNVVDGLSTEKLEKRLDGINKKIRDNAEAQRELINTIKILEKKPASDTLGLKDLKAYSNRLNILIGEMKELIAARDKANAILDAPFGDPKPKPRGAGPTPTPTPPKGGKGGKALQDLKEVNQEIEDEEFEHMTWLDKMTQDAESLGWQRKIEQHEREQELKKEQLEEDEKAKIRQAELDKKLDEEREARRIKMAEAEKTRQRMYFKFSFDIMSDIAKTGMEFAKQNSKTYKAFAIAQVVISTAKAIMAAFEPPPIGYGPLLAPFKATAIGAMGAAQITTIANAKAFHTGGLVTGSGEVPAVLEAGEFVVRKEIVSSMGTENLQAINEGNSNVSVANFFDTDSLDEYLSSYKGQQAIINAINM